MSISGDWRFHVLRDTAPLPDAKLAEIAAAHAAHPHEMCLDVPVLLAEVRRLRERIAELEAAATALKKDS